MLDTLLLNMFTEQTAYAPRGRPQPLPEGTRTIPRVFTVKQGLPRKAPQSERGSRRPSPGRPCRSYVISQCPGASYEKRRRVSEVREGPPKVDPRDHT